MKKTVLLVDAFILVFFAFGQTTYGAQPPRQSPTGWGPYKIGMTVARAIAISNESLITSNTVSNKLIGYAQIGSYKVQSWFFYSEFGKKIYQIELWPQTINRCNNAEEFFLSSLTTKYGKPEKKLTRSMDILTPAKYHVDYFWAFPNRFLIDLSVGGALGGCPSVIYRYKSAPTQKSTF